MSAGAKEVLLVEDDPVDVMLMEDAVKAGRGLMELKIVNDGRDALAYLRAQGRFAAARKPALMLLDWRLPGLDGEGVLREVRRDPALRLTPVIVLTSSASERDVQTAYELGANCFLTKPTGLEELRSLVLLIEELWARRALLPVL